MQDHGRQHKAQQQAQQQAQQPTQRGRRAPAHHLLCGGIRLVRSGVMGAIVLALGIALAVVATPPTYATDGATTHEAQASIPATIFPTDGQGLYDSCNPADPACLGNLDAMARGGFQLVLNYSQFTSSATLSDEIAYARHAASVGLHILWPVDEFTYADGRAGTLAAAFPALGASLGQPGVCPGYNGTNYEFVACFVRAVSGLPSTWGYYIGDELPASREQGVRPLVDAIYDADSAHPRLYVAGSKGTSVNSADLAAYARSYCDDFECHSDATVIAQDFYPVGSSPPDQIAAQTDAIAAGVEALARQYNVTYAMVLQAHSLAQYPALYRNCQTTSACPYPTQQQMLAMRDAVLAHATPRLVLWYSYFDLERSDNFTQHWLDTQIAANWGKPVVIRGSVMPSASPPPVTTPAAPTPAVRSANTATVHQSPQKAEAASTDDVLTPLGRFSATAIEALAQLVLLFVLIGGTRLAIGRTMPARLPRR